MILDAIYEVVAGAGALAAVFAVAAFGARWFDDEGRLILRR